MWSAQDVTVLVPMLGRAHTIDPLVASLTDTTPGADVLFLTTPDDADVRDHLDARGLPRLDVTYERRGDYARKINAGCDAVTRPLVFTGACDLRFHDQWLPTAAAAMTDGIDVVGTNDACNPRTARGHSTHSLVRRSYARRGLIDGGPGLLNPAYWHEYVDDEMIGTAQRRGVYAHAATSVVEHLHPMARTAPMDAMYAAQRERMRYSRSYYLTRRRLWT